MIGLELLAMAPPPGGAGEQQSPLFMLGPMVILVILMYVMMIRPQQRKEKERQALLQQVKSGDRILFSGGIIGVVTNVKDKTLVVKVAEKTKVEILRAAVTRILDKGELPSEVDQTSA